MSWAAQVFGCRKKMSAIAILDYGGANELFHQMSALAKKGRVDYMLYYNEDESNALPEMDPMVSLLTAPLAHSPHASMTRSLTIPGTSVVYAKKIVILKKSIILKKTTNYDLFG